MANQYLEIQTSAGYISILVSAPPVPPTQQPTLSCNVISTSELDFVIGSIDPVASSLLVRTSPDGVTYGTPFTISLNGNPTTWPDTGLSPGTTVYAEAAAQNSGGAGPWSTPASGTTNTIGTPTNIGNPITLTNNGPADLAAGTFYWLGQPIEGPNGPDGSSVPSTKLLQATYTPSGPASPRSINVQVSSKSTWSDGALKHCGVGIQLPVALLKGQTASLQWQSLTGTQTVTLPNSKHVSDILTDLQNNFPFTVTCLNGVVGREYGTVVAGGTGYKATSTVTLSDGTVSTTGGVNVNATTGAITQIWFTRPSTNWVGTPTLTISDGTGANITVHIPAKDGSGSWTWTANTWLNKYNTAPSAGGSGSIINNACQTALGGGWDGGLDSAGRKVVEVIEAGPLCCTFRVWGPFADNTGGALHPQLAIIAYLRCWLDTSGAIVNVEHLFAVRNGWMGDLNGGTVPSDMQTGDFAVNITGGAYAASPTNGLAFARIYIPHHTTHPLTTLDSTTRYTAGSHHTGSAAYPTIDVAVDRDYWLKTFLVQPHDWNFFRTNPLQTAWQNDLPASCTATDTAPPTFAPGARATSQKPAIIGEPFFGYCPGWLGNGGEHTHIGLDPEWAVRAFVTQDPGYVQGTLTSAFFGMTHPSWIMNPLTGRIPCLTQALADSSNAKLGANTATVTQYSPNTAAGTGISADILAVWRQGDGTKPGSYDTSGLLGGWGYSVVQEQFNPTHYPSWGYHAYLRTAAPWILDLVCKDGNVAVITRTPGAHSDNATYHQPYDSLTGHRDFYCPDGTLVHGRVEWIAQDPRNAAWGRKLVAQALVCCPDADLRKSYFAQLDNDNDTIANKIIAGLSANFRALGVWDGPNTRSGSGSNYGSPPWMRSYAALAGLYRYGALEKASATFLAHFKKALIGRSGQTSGAGGWDSPWGTTGYRDVLGPGQGYLADTGGDFFASWSACAAESYEDPMGLDGPSGKVTSCYTSAGVLKMDIARTPGAQLAATQVGDLFMFCTCADIASAITYLQNPGNPPATCTVTDGTGNTSTQNVSAGQFFPVKSVDATGHTVTLWYDLAKTLTITGWPVTINGVYTTANPPGVGVSRLRPGPQTETANADSGFAGNYGDNTAASYLPLLYAIAQWYVALGLASSSDAWVQAYVNGVDDPTVGARVQKRWATFASDFTNWAKYKLTPTL